MEDTAPETASLDTAGAGETVDSSIHPTHRAIVPFVSRHLVSRQGSGSVAQLPPGRGHRGDHLLAPGVSDDDLPGDGSDVVDLTCAAPAPAPEVLEAFRRGVEALPAHLGVTGYYPSGLAVLR